MTDNSRMVKKPVSKARGSEAASLRQGYGWQAGVCCTDVRLSAVALAKVEERR